MIFMDSLCGKISHIVPDIKPPEGSAGYSADNAMPQGSACSAMKSSWNSQKLNVDSPMPLHPISMCSLSMINRSQKI